MNKIILIEDDAKTAAQIKNLLGDYSVEIFAKAESALSALGRNKPALIILDHDIREMDGLELLRRIHRQEPPTRVIMLSSSNDIPLAVSATKLGASDFLKKPVSGEALLAAVKRNLVPLGEPETTPEINESLASRQNIILLAERGINKLATVEIIHAHSLKKNRKLQTIDLAAFRRENLEGAFWAAVQKFVGETGISTQNDEDRCGTLYLENIESLEANFRQSIFQFFNQPGEVLVIIGIVDDQVFEGAQIKNYFQARLAPLRERKADLPFCLSRALDKYAAKHGKKVKGISAEALLLLSQYDWPGNFSELNALVEEAVLVSSGELLELKDLPLTFSSILDMSANRAKLEGKNKLAEAKNEFEKITYRLLTSKSEADLGAVARYLDMPRNVIAERIEELGQSLLN